MIFQNGRGFLPDFHEGFSVSVPSNPLSHNQRREFHSQLRGSSKRFACSIIFSNRMDHIMSRIILTIMPSEPLHGTNKAKMEIWRPPEPRHLRADVLPHSPRTRRGSCCGLRTATIIVVLFDRAVARAPHVVISSRIITPIDLVGLLRLVVFQPLARGRASRI